jgi:hypothetical protein
MHCDKITCAYPFHSLCWRQDMPVGGKHCKTELIGSTLLPRLTACGLTSSIENHIFSAWARFVLSAS